MIPQSLQRVDMFEQTNLAFLGYLRAEAYTALKRIDAIASKNGKNSQIK